MFKCTPVFLANKNSTAKIKVNQGGTSSSKTYSIMQLAFDEGLQRRMMITITGESIPNLKKGAYRDAESILSVTPDLAPYIKSWHKAERIITLINGTKIEFISNENEQSAKNGKRDMLFVNEANGVPYGIFFQMAIRTRGTIYIDYNPTAPFWAHEKLIGTSPEENDFNATVDLLISDHRHNPFLSEEEHAKIEGIKDKELWKVYARGLTGNVEGLVYPGWKRIPNKEFFDIVDGHNFIGGLDFGYVNDQTAGVKVWVIHENIYVQELCYKPGIPTDQLKQTFESAGFTKRHVLYCDHDPHMYLQLQRAGMQAIPAHKGKDSVLAGIDYIKKTYNVYYNESSKNIHNERIGYMWVKDKNTNKPTNTPEDKANHLMDAIRYAVYSHYVRTGK